ncbi:exonuclease sbcD [Vibrio ishigakensis]|uniref:Exonuclease sbcD n=1 Tax=Vibrio ishigakensis TaxID=1481914 RepID=A0A0B8P4I0_9VIBR|nr:exonuclease sbcD [Vibrio ishigakensis]
MSEQDFLSDLQQRIAEMVKGLNVEVLQLRRARTSAKQAIEQKKTETLAELKPQDVFKRRLELETLTSEQEQARIERISLTFGEILNQVELDGEEQH